MANGFKVDNASGAPGINIWSRGPIYPLVIARRERYSHINLYNNGAVADVRAVLDYAYWDVLNADDDMSGFASYDDALAAAKGWLERDGNFYDTPVVLSPFNPAAFDAELAEDFVDEFERDLRADAVAAMGGA